MRLSVSLFTLIALQSALSESPGICSVSHVVEKQRYVMDRTVSHWRKERYNDTVVKEECCSGYRTVKLEPLSCSPICDPECENSDCMLPNTCICHPGHLLVNNSTSSCYDVCDSCVNGGCRDENDVECICNPGYIRDPYLPHICDPFCSPFCINALCTAPSFCECYHGFKPHPDDTQNNICIPLCTEDCVFGECTDPDVCTCFEGYINDKDSPSICLPVCNNTCVNGYCYAPDVCRCLDEFELHPRNPYQCVPKIPKESFSNFCVLTMPQAVRYDNDSGCFLLKDQIILNVPPQCRVIQSQSGSFCSHHNHCHRSECVLNFMCSAVQINGSKEVHCNLQEHDIEVDSTNIDHIVNATEWIDVVLVVNSFPGFQYSLENKQNSTKEWILQPSSKSPVCGGMVFAVELSECEISNLATQENNHINSSFMFWMNVFLISGFLLLVGAGVGGFLWARHRRLNDPLNYRGDMMHGYYNNQSYENQPADELVSDDSDENCDALL